MRKRQMKLGLSMRYLGYHDGAWRHQGVPAGGQSDFQYFLYSARIAERGKFDMVFFADGIGIRANDDPPGSLARSNRNAELEPITLLSALAPMTSNIGLVTTASTTYNEPYHIARKFASLDHISGGRAGWNVVTLSPELRRQRRLATDRHACADRRCDGRMGHPGGSGRLQPNTDPSAARDRRFCRVDRARIAQAGTVSQRIREHDLAWQSRTARAGQSLRCGTRARGVLQRIGRDQDVPLVCP